MATYKDYVVYVQDGEGDEQLWLALHPTPETKPEYYDAILNGVEISRLMTRTCLALILSLQTCFSKIKQRKRVSKHTNHMIRKLSLGELLEALQVLPLWQQYALLFTTRRKEFQGQGEPHTQVGFPSMEIHTQMAVNPRRGRALPAQTSLPWLKVFVAIFPCKR